MIQELYFYDENETVKEYLCRICRTTDEKHKILQFLKIIQNKEDQKHPSLNNDFDSIIPLKLRKYLNMMIKLDFNLPCLLSNHFTIRLLSRFKNESIYKIMNDIQRAFTVKDSSSLGNGIIKLYGTFYSIVYSNINNILLTIIPYRQSDSDKNNNSRNDFVKCRRNNGHNRIKKGIYDDYEEKKNEKHRFKKNKHSIKEF